MSFYLGKDIDDKNILHITKTPASSFEMQGGILESSVYHTDMVFVDYEEFDIPNIVQVPYFCPSSRIIPPYVPVNKIPYSALSDRAVQLLKEGRLFTIVDDTYTQVYNPSGNVFSRGWYGSVSNYNLDSVFYTNSGCGERRYSYNSPLVTALGVTGEFNTVPKKILIFNIRHDGSFIDLYPKTSEEIVLNRSQVLVRGVDFSSLYYIQNKQYPGSKLITTANAGSLYRISPPGSGNFSINVSENSSVISMGSSVLVDSNNPPSSNHISRVVSIPININTGDNFNLTNLMSLMNVSNYLGRTVLVSVNCVQGFKNSSGVVAGTKDIVTTSITSLKNNEVISMVGYNFTFGTYFNATAFYGAFNQLVLRVVNGVLYLSAKTSRHPYNNSSVSYNGNYGGPRDDLKFDGVITLCIL